MGDFTLICYPAALIFLLNNLRFLFLLSSVLSFVLRLDGGQRMREELYFVRGIVNLIVLVDLADRSEDKTFRRDVPERQHCRSAR